VGPRKSKVPETNKQIFFSRIEEFAGAIHSYGVENLYKELRSKAYITESYPLETFRTDFKRMKNSENGLLNEPAMLGGILEILHFPADALFGGPSASIEDNRETVKATIINTMQDIEKQKRTPQKRIFNSRMIDRAWKVHNIIRNNYSLSYPQLGYFLNEPFRLLFAGYSAQDKSWDHAKETRIKTILENILKGSKGSSYYYYYPNMSPPFFSPSADPYDTYWNNCLIISYQLSCIESLYSIFQKSKKTKKHTQKGQPVFIDSPTIIQNVTLENEGQDIFAVEFDKSCKSFDDMISNSKYLPTAGFLKIISNFQEILRTLLCPKWTNTVPQNPLGDSLIYQFIQPTNVFINNFELEITDKEINMLRENAKLLTDQNMGAVNQSSENHSNIVQKIPKDAYNIGQEERLLTDEEQDRMIEEDIMRM
jgi:hypothetical protein